MKYNLINKMRNEVQKYDMTREEVMETVNTFIAFNPNGRVKTEGGKIAYYNRKSFYKIEEASA